MKLKFNTFIFISILFVCFSCKKENQGFLESSLKFAGENRTELEKVLEVSVATDANAECPDSQPYSPEGKCLEGREI